MQFTITPITPQLDETVCDIIKKVGTEFGAIGDGFGPSDDEVNHMSAHYREANRCGYWVVMVNGKAVGCGGIAPFNGSDTVCELRKLFLLPDCRGLGIGKALTEHCLNFAKQQQYQQCYLDTLSNMDSAIQLYKKLGFKQLTTPMLGTEHNGCDVWMLKDL